ncbi:hypothetical protein C2845_PM17G07990 [Panicum miliaceum]|uniref:Uncharacterized protein n=1 Tax=Panicum miliaceum TaxID=4540 RepID=A0A3L6PYX6_PANMI|nr:hypothetical protein C2845_PM17G07990 [Panicum miliaceum]
MTKFLKSVYDLARGEVHTEQPVWGRELLIARATPHVTHKHSAYDQLPAFSAAAEDVVRKTPLEHMRRQEGIVFLVYLAGPQESGPEEKPSQHHHCHNTRLNTIMRRVVRPGIVQALRSGHGRLQAAGPPALALAESQASHDARPPAMTSAPSLSN